MLDNREAFYSTNVVMEADAVLDLNYTQDLKKKIKSCFLLEEESIRVLRRCAAVAA